MTGQTTSNYTVTGSSWYNNPATGGSGTQYEPWKAFNAKYGFQTGTDVWYSFAYTGTQSYTCKKCYACKHFYMCKIF